MNEEDTEFLETLIWVRYVFGAFRANEECVRMARRFISSDPVALCTDGHPGLPDFVPEKWVEEEKR